MKEEWIDRCRVLMIVLDRYKSGLSGLVGDVFRDSANWLVDNGFLTGGGTYYTLTHKGGLLAESITELTA